MSTAAVRDGIHTNKSRGLRDGGPAAGTKTNFWSPEYFMKMLGTWILNL